jgi:hypothetical protein
MKRLTVLLFILTFAYIQFGYYSHSMALRSASRRKFEKSLLSALPDSFYQVFELNKIANEIDWEEEGKEFWLDDVLFDVAKRKVINGKMYLYCLKDTKEKQVVEQQLKLTKNNAGNGPGKSAKVVQFNLPDIILDDVYDNLFIATSSRLKYPVYAAGLLVQYKQPLSPPPQV